MLEIILLLLGGLIGLVVGGELLVRGASRLAESLGIPSVVIGLTVVAFGTSTPELAVSLDAAFAGNADIAVANVVGSNIFNVLFILGVAALVCPLVVHSQLIRREIPIMVGVTALFYALAWGGHVNRWEGLFLFVGILVYTTWVVREAIVNKSKNAELVQEWSEASERPTAKKDALWMALMFIVIGLGLVMLGADWLVDGAIALAKNLGVSDTVIGLTIVAAGTSLPEVVASVIAAAKGERDIAIGNVVGSNIYNILAIIGLSGFIVPQGLAVSESMLMMDFPVMLAVAGLCWLFVVIGKEITRWKGAIFLGAYIAYTAVLIANAT